jgi:branched-chain amino acid transport system substrate-binding protein
MKRVQQLAVALALASAMGLAQAQAPVKIGMITTLSTAGGYLGEDVRDGFMLAVAQENGQLGGVPVQVLIEDDGLSPEQARQIATRMVEGEGVSIVTGTIFSNVAMALVPRLVRDDVIVLSPNAGPSQLAGAMCHENYFNVAWQNDNLHEAMGQFVLDSGYGNVYILAPNYPAGRDAMAGFKRYFTGGLAGETYTQLGQTDFAAEISLIRAANPDAVFFFLPGGMGVNFTRQYHQAGMSARVPLFGPAFSFDNILVSAVGEAAEGVFNTSQWSADLDVPANQAFVAAFIERHGRIPTLYASQGYDTARLLASALAAVDGDIGDRDGLRAALKRADFESVRGGFRFGNNQHPIQDIHVREVVRNADGVLTNRLVGRVFEAHQDAFAVECPLP